ncbi:MAG: hypothetical protein LBR15_00490, partial [Methanobrevibacter sp.]|nr:hypothetical protein [Candidatus Methanovirga australis]
GGAVFITGGVNYLNNCTFINNQAENEGGGIITDNMSTRCYFNECNISNNVAKYGGGISAYKGIVEVRNSAINGNIANIDGGGANIVNGTGHFENCNICHNNAAEGGGGISIFNGIGRTQLSNITNNSAFNGGGIKNNCWCMVESSSLIYNTAKNFGGGIYNTGNSIGLSLIMLKPFKVKTRLYYNSAFYGGGLYDDKGNAEFNGTSIHLNEVSNIRYGGGICSRNLDVGDLFDGIINDCSDNIPDGSDFGWL